MTDAWRQKAIDHMIAAYPAEGCGLVVRPKGKRSLVFYPCENLDAAPGHRFAMDPEGYALAEDSGTVVAVVHSHPDEPARASEADKVMCEASQLPWHILRIDGKGLEDPEFVDWVQIEPNGFKAPLVGREFSYGILDCYTLLQDYYEQEMGQRLPDFDHGPDGWWDDETSDFDPYMQHFEEAGFYEIPKPAERGDLILMQIRSKAHKMNHAGVYIGDGLMLHHLHGHLSTREVYGGYWAQMTRKILRRKE